MRGDAGRETRPDMGQANMAQARSDTPEPKNQIEYLEKHLAEANMRIVDLQYELLGLYRRLDKGGY